MFTNQNGLSIRVSCRKGCRRSDTSSIKETLVWTSLSICVDDEDDSSPLTAEHVVRFRRRGMLNLQAADRLDSVLLAIASLRRLDWSLGRLRWRRRDPRDDKLTAATALTSLLALRLRIRGWPQMSAMIVAHGDDSDRSSVRYQFDSRLLRTIQFVHDTWKENYTQAVVLVFVY